MDTEGKENLPESRAGIGVPPLLMLLSAQQSVRDGVFEWLIGHTEATRKSYLGCLKEFAGWMEGYGLRLEDIRALHVEAYKLHVLGRPKRYAESDKTTPATARQQLSAIKSLLGFLEVRALLDRNAAASVRHPRNPYRSGRGSTPILTEAELGIFFKQFDKPGADLTILDLRDYAISATLYFAWPRVEALARLQVHDYYQEGGRWWLRFFEKEGQIHRTEVHPELKEILDRYVDAAGIEGDLDGPIFRSVRGRSQRLQRRAITADNIRDMMQARGEAVGLSRVKPGMIRPSSYTRFRELGGSREHGQLNFGHAFPATTDIYDRRQEIQKAQEERMRRLSLKF
jgi:site-specific recombinase XerD